MEWYEKEERFEQAFRTGRVANDLWRYIPWKSLDGISQAFTDQEGYWIWLKEDYVAYDGAEDCGTIHEYTLADLKEAIKTIRRKEQ